MQNINDILAELAAADNLRTLRDAVPDGKHITYDGRRYLNLSSNDYLGLSGDEDLQKRFFESLPADRFVMSNPSSRLMTGNSTDYAELEHAIAAMYRGERSALVLGSGYSVNSGLLPAATAKGDLILADKLVHASIIDGLRLCDCEWQRFNHNDMEHLERLVAKNRAAYDNIWVVTESVFSMDGDTAPVRALVELKRKYGLHLYIDEAHAFGVIGESGAGLAHSEGLDEEFDVIIATFGKAISSCGAFAVVGPQLRELLINRMRTLIFSTALPPINLMWTKFIVDMLPQLGARREHLRKLISILAPDTPEATHIIPLMAYDNGRAMQMAESFKERGYWVTPVRYPTVPRDKARVRLSLSAALSEQDVRDFKTCIDAIRWI